MTENEDNTVYWGNWYRGSGEVEDDQHYRSLVRPTIMPDPDHPSMQKLVSEKYLDVAAEIIHGGREQQYAHPYDDFTRIGNLWSAFLGVEISPKQVAAMMVLLKCARLSHNIDHEDSWIDMAGYVGCADRVQRRIDGVE